MFWPPKMSHSFIQNCCRITPQFSHHQGWKTCVKKWKVKLIFRGAWNNLMASSDWSWPPPPIFYDRSMRHCLRPYSDLPKPKMTATSTYLKRTPCVPHADWNGNTLIPSVFWLRWLGDRQDIWPVKKSCFSNPRMFFFRSLWRIRPKLD